MLDFFLDDDNVSSVHEKMNSEETGQIARVFNAINANLSSELVSKTGAIYKFNVKGNFFSFLSFIDLNAIYNNAIDERIDISIHFHF